MFLLFLCCCAGLAHFAVGGWAPPALAGIEAMLTYVSTDGGAATPPGIFSRTAAGFQLAYRLQDGQHVFAAAGV